MDCPNPKRRSAVVAGLPDDLLVDILARVPARSLCRSKCVAKAWRDLIEDPLHRKMLPQTLQGFFFVDEKIHGRRRPIEFASLQRKSKSAPLQIDTSLSFLTKRPGIETLTFSDCCNGLLLFENKQKSRPFDLLSYVVSNPATEQWVVVPRHGPPALAHVREEATRYNYLVFDPSISSHFHLVHFGWESKESMEFEDGFAFDDDDDDDDGVHLVHFHNIEEGEMYRTTLHVYSSVTGKWTRMQSGWSQIQSEWGWGEHNLEAWHHQGLVPYQRSRCAVLNGMLHFVTSDHRIAAVDVQEATEKIIPLPAMPEKKSWPEPGYVAQSQGKLHYINKKYDDGLFIWDLEDYGARAWVLKHSVSFKELFGQNSRTWRKNDYSVVAMHPDGNVVFIVQDWNLKLVSYQMDRKPVSVIGTLDNQMDRKLASVIGTLSDDDQMVRKLFSAIENFEDNTSTIHVVPYVPCFSESLVLTNKH